jgi:hypothetical protein
VRRTKILILLLIMALVPLAPEVASGRSPVVAHAAAVAVMTSASAPAAAGEQFCWFCWKEVGQLENPVTQELEFVTIAECVSFVNGVDPYWEGGGTFCSTPPNLFDEWGEYHGGVCEMYDWMVHSGPTACDCTHEGSGVDPYWAVSPDCEASVPARELGFDGYSAWTTFASVAENAPLAQDRTCQGLILSVGVPAQDSARMRAALLEIRI